MLVESQNLGDKTKFWPKLDVLTQKILTKIQYLEEKSKILVNNRNLYQKKN